jgi:hypothetical protein
MLDKKGEDECIIAPAKRTGIPRHGQIALNEMAGGDQQGSDGIRASSQPQRASIAHGQALGATSIGRH